MFELSALQGKKVAAWFVSNCDSESGRERVVEELRQHLSVEVCSTLHCS